jgi:hypothetical protein
MITGEVFSVLVLVLAALAVASGLPNRVMRWQERRYWRLRGQGMPKRLSARHLRRKP